MRLIFIRHAEPDYMHNTLTEKGFREARILAERTKNWKVTQFYESPIARAQLTAEPTLEAQNRDAVVLDWMKEFAYGETPDPTTGEIHHVSWDFMPQWWTEQHQLFDPENFYEHPILAQNDGYVKAVHNLRTGMDELLNGYGYTRSGLYYTFDPDKNGKQYETDDEETTLVFFAHLGANLEAIGYLLHLSPVQLQHVFYIAPTSISVLNMEKRMPGVGMFRAQCIGDVTHLLDAGEPISGPHGFGAFSSLFGQ